MKKTIFSNLNKVYLTEKLGLDLFSLARGTYDSLADDNIVPSGVSDRLFAGLLLENSLSSDHFYSRENLKEFVKSLPENYQLKIKSKFDINNLTWDDSLYDFLNENYGVNDKFKPSKTQSNEESKSVLYFKEPQFYFKNLKDYQSELFFRVYDYINRVNFARCILQMPTGSGKTRTSMEIICEFLNNHDSNVLWLANSEELVDQAFDSFNEVWQFRGQKQMFAFNHMRLKGKIDFNVQCFQVSTLQGLNSKKGKVLIQNLLNSKHGIGLIIVDEAHISIAPTYKKTINLLLSQEAKLIGLTATPGRSIIRFENNAIDDNQELSDFYFNKLFQINTGNVSPLDFLRERGILSNARFFSIEGSYINTCLSDAEIRKMNETKRIPPKIIETLSNDSRRNAIIIDKLTKLLNEGKKILFFATSLDHSKVIASLINLIGFSAAHVDGDSGSNRSSIIKSFKEGRIKFLSNFGVLSTGFDDPQIDVVFMARPTNSIVLYSQIIGRGLRGPKIGGTDICDVYTVNDNIVDLPSNNEIYSYFEDYFINHHVV